MSTYLGEVIRVSKKNKLRLDQIKQKRRFKSFDSVISKMLDDSGFEKPKKKPLKKMKLSIFDTSEFGL